MLQVFYDQLSRYIYSSYTPDKAGAAPYRHFMQPMAHDSAHGTLDRFWLVFCYFGLNVLSLSAIHVMINEKRNNF